MTSASTLIKITAMKKISLLRVFGYLATFLASPEKFEASIISLSNRFKDFSSMSSDTDVAQ